MRRVKSAVCAFGGSLHPVPTNPTNRDVIFRGIPGRWSQHQFQYSQRLHRRYFLRSDQISWEVEEHPPIEIESSNFLRGSISAVKTKLSTASRENRSSSASPDTIASNDSDGRSTPSPINSVDENTHPKMRYRCKLCNQPKQNHNCPYRQSMQRSIGISALPSINAYTSHEPGSLAPALSDMNNFVSKEALTRIDSNVELPEVSTSAKIATINSSDTEATSPRSELMEQGTTEITPPPSSSAPPESRKRTHDKMRAQRPHFANVVSLCPEQYRSISSYHTDEPTYQYALMPLTFAERKRLTDTLFALSKDLPPPFSEEISVILHGARQRDMWDPAVAELLTQIVVALYCQEGDKRLEGLRKYLVGLGVSC